jgi:hypothetical protein
MSNRIRHADFHPEMETAELKSLWSENARDFFFVPSNKIAIELDPEKQTASVQYDLPINYDDCL